MISPGQVKELDDHELCEQLEKRLETLSLCVEAISTNHNGTVGLCWAFDDADTLAREVKQRLWDRMNDKEV